MGPFEEHLRDAIRINRQRAPQYSRLTQGRSQAISRWLIFSELLTLPSAKFIDLCGSYFYLREVPILKEDFMSMDKVPVFQEKMGFKTDSFERFDPQNGYRLSLIVFWKFCTGGFQAAAFELERELNRLNLTPTFHPMLKHVLESMIRIANLAPIHEMNRKSKGLFFSTLPLSRYLFLSHFLAIPFACWLDQKAAPLHAEGIPILHQDVPPIPIK